MAPTILIFLAVFCSLLLLVAVVAIVTDKKVDVVPMPVYLHAFLVAILWAWVYYLTH